LFNPFPALAAALIWAFSPIYYRGFLGRFELLNLNFLRTGLSAAVLLVPALVFGSGFGAGIGYALLSGLVTLGMGDTMFLLAIRETGASVAAPVVYTYVLMVQFVGVALGQVIPYANIAAALMVVAGVFILSRGGEGKPRAKGVAFALTGALLWTAGQEMIQLATNAGGDVLTVTFVRNAAAATALGIALLLTGKARKWPRGLSSREIGFVAIIIVSDLVLGSLLFVYSISTIGVALTVIVTSLSPFITQVSSRALGKESPSAKDYAGGALIVAALVIAVAL
jgi:drug/metabolite transporter, DME family